MQYQSYVGTLLLLITGLATYRAFKNMKYMEDNIFYVDGILIGKQYQRLITSGFLHANWWHFGFNMLALVSFSMSVELQVGRIKFAIIYFLALIGGNLLALFIHRNHGDYRALGASGAISGVILATIILNPLGQIGFILLPISFPNWLFGILFMVISIFGIKSQSGNIGHEAHMGGAIIGALSMLAFNPSILHTNWWIVILVLIPPIFFLYLIIKNPAVLHIQNYWGQDQFKRPKLFGKKKGSAKIIEGKFEKEKRMNDILEKIKRDGIDSLSEKERSYLENPE